MEQLSELLLPLRLQKLAGILGDLRDELGRNFLISWLTEYVNLATQGLYSFPLFLILSSKSGPDAPGRDSVGKILDFQCQTEPLPACLLLHHC